jgi:AMMECR1 domain-containing protein
MVVVSSAPAPGLAADARRWLLHVARRALRDAMALRDPAAANLSLGTDERPDDARLGAPTPVYVTWYDDGASAFAPRAAARVGTLGSVEPGLPLEQAVARYAVHAGLDARVPATRARWHRLVAEICLPGPSTELSAVGLDEICAALVPGRDGVLLSAGSRHPAVALPGAWRFAPRPRDFLAAVMRDAGLSPERDGPRLRVRTFLAETFAEPARRVPAAEHLPQLHVA